MASIKFASIGGWAMVVLLAWGTLGAAQNVTPSSSSPLTAEEIRGKLRTTVLEDDGYPDFLVNISVWVPDLHETVTTTMLWASRKAGRPFQYFKKGMSLRAPQVDAELAIAASLDAEEMKRGLRAVSIVPLSTTNQQFITKVVGLAKTGAILPSFVQKTYTTSKARLGIPTNLKYKSFHDEIVKAAAEHGITL